MKSIVFLLLASIILLLLPNEGNAQLFQYGVVGKKTTTAVVGAVNDATKAVNNATTTVNGLKVSIINYLRDSIDQTLKNSVKGILDGAIESLGDKRNQQGLDSLIDGLIKHSMGETREELILFKNDLLDYKFRAQLRETLKSIMNEVFVNPASSLLDTAVSDNTRSHIEKLLRMVIPATLNDSSIHQVSQLREALLGDGMKKDVSGLLDTVLGTLNNRLKGDLPNNINKIMSQNADTISDKAKGIIRYLIIGAALVGLILILLGYYLKRKLETKNNMLFTVSNSIEQFKKNDGTPDEKNFHKLTDAIRTNMVSMQLEDEMKKFLIKKNINKPSDYA